MASNERSVETAASPQAVWKVWTDTSRWQEWNPDVQSMSFDGPLAPGSEFRSKAGPGTIVSTLDRIEPPLHIAWRGRTLTINAYHEWWLEPSDGGTHARTEESFSGLLVRLLRGSLQKTLDKSLQDGLQHLKHEAERRSA